MQPVLVTGATGRVGRVVVAQLLDAGVPVRALTRLPAAAGLPAGVEVVSGDLSVPESLDAGLQGVSAVFLVWTAPPTTAPAVVERLATHARRVVFLSSPHRTPHPFFSSRILAALHAEIERLIAGAGLASTIIRPGCRERAALVGGPDSRGGAVRASTARPRRRRSTSATSRPWRSALYEDGHAGGDYVLTGPESLSQAEQVSIIGATIGRRIQFEELSPEQFRREMAGRWPGPVVDMLLAAWGAAIGRPAFVTSTVSDVVGSPPRTFRQWVADHTAAFQERPESYEV
jgi:uncharacterized protein YbjT (DUF2867 family)